MANPSPLDERFEQADAQFLPFGEAVRLVAMPDLVETEYGRLRNRAAIMDCPHRGLVKVTGRERLAFLHRMLTNDCAGLTPGAANRHFLLTAKGRIIADLILLHEAEATWVDLELPNVGPFIEEMDKLLFGEDVVFEDISGSHHRFSLHGKSSHEALDDRSAATFEALAAEAHRRVTIAGVEGLCYRRDQCGVAGYHLWAPADRALRQRFPTLLTVIVPRHPSRADAVAARLDRPDLARAADAADLDPATGVLLVDRFGALGLFYRLAEVALVGGSLVAHGGQNPLEPARLERPVLFGPHMANFAELARALVTVGGAREGAGDGLADVVARWLDDAAARRRAGAAVLARTTAAIRGAIDRPRGRPPSGSGTASRRGC